MKLSPKRIDDTAVVAGVSAPLTPAHLRKSLQFVKRIEVAIVAVALFDLINSVKEDIIIGTRY